MMGFDFPLLSDPDRVAGEAMEAMRPPDDPWPNSPRRLTYVIDPDLTITHAYDVGRDIQGHADQVLADLRSAIVGA